MADQDITNIMSILGGEKMATPSGFVPMAAELRNGCHNYKLTGTSACGDLDSKTVFLEIPAFDPLTYRRVIKGRETGSGLEVKSWWSVEPLVKFSIVMDEATRNIIEIIAEHQTIALTRLIGDGSPEVAAIRKLELQPSAEESWLRVEFTLEFREALMINKLCCGSFYDGGPFLECDGEGETGDPNNDPTCEGLTVEITLSEGPVLTATPAGGPGTGIESFTWYLDGVLFGSGASIMPTLPGVYRVDYQIGNCPATAEFTYSDLCEDYEITIQELILMDGTHALLATPNLIGTLKWQESLSSVWTDIVGETGLLFYPEHSGLYRAVGVSAGECEDNSNEVTVDLGTVCDGLYTLAATNEGANIVATISDYEGEGTPEFHWYLDTGEGPVDTGNTGESIPVTEPGLYVVQVTLDGCVQYFQIFVNCEAIANPCGDPCGFPFQDFGPGVTGDQFSVTNFVLLDPALFTEDQVNATFIAFKNGQRIGYITPLSLAGLSGADNKARAVWSIDYATQRAILHPSWPLKATEVFTVLRLR